MKRYFEYKEFVYEPYEEVESDGENSKIWHDVKNTKTGEVRTLDWTPYSYLTLTQFQWFVEAGFPDRFTIRSCGGPLSEDELHQLRMTKITNEVRQNLIKGAR